MASIPPSLIGSSPTQTPLVIGGISLTVPNSPSELGLGAGEQKTVVIPLIGGGRAVQKMGAQPDEVTIQGTLYAPDIATIYPILHSYMVDGKDRLITWGPESYYGSIKKVTPKYRNGGQILDYTLILEITKDANGAFSAALPSSVDSQVNSLASTTTVSAAAIAAADSSAPASLTTDAANVQIALDSTGPIGQASSTNISSLLTTVQGALANATAYAGSLAETSPAFISAKNLVTSLTLIADNVQSGQSQRTVTVQGKSLFEIAAQYYGDPTKAFDLAAVNGLPGPQLSSVVSTTLRLPPYPPV